MRIELHPIRLNEPRSLDPDILAICEGTKALYTRVGFAPPWIGYLAKIENEVVGTCAFRSAPRSGRVEIVFVTLPQFEKRGFATEMARRLVEIAHRADASLLVAARTDVSNPASGRVLAKIGFQASGPQLHPQEGEVVEWILMPESLMPSHDLLC